MKHNHIQFNRPTNLSENNSYIFAENNKDNCDDQQTIPNDNVDNDIYKWCDNENYILGYN